MAEFKTELEKFDPQISELVKIAEVAKKITVSDLRDTKQLTIAKDKRVELKKLRVEIEKAGKTLRDDANSFNKAVLTKQKQMIAVIEPEEQRLLEIESKSKELVEIDKREELLPNRLEKLSNIGDGLTIADGEILAMDDLQFGIYFNSRTEARNARQQQLMEIERENERIRKEEEAKEIQEKIDAENAKIEEGKRKLEEGKRELEHQKELAEAKKNAEKEARAEAEQRVQDERMAEQTRLKEEQADKKAEEIALAKRKEYQKFLSANGYTEKTKADFHIEDNESEVTLYKKLGTFKK